MFPMMGAEAGNAEPQTKPLKTINKAILGRKINFAIAQCVELLDWRAIWLTLLQVDDNFNEYLP
jgi:hypothetical protein